jgi:ankyrin repeat protein
VKAALLALPATLDETYERMLQKISVNDQQYALCLLRWLAYAHSPLTLEELAEASTIYPGEDVADDVVATDDRGGWEDALDVLAGLVVTIESSSQDATNGAPLSDGLAEPHDRDSVLSKDLITKSTTIRLAHFSVKEYLESPRIAGSIVQTFKLDPGRDHRWITQSCLAYLIHYSNCMNKSSSEQDRFIFPLLEYSATTWYRHALLEFPLGCDRPAQFLTCDSYRKHWLLVHQPEIIWARPFSGRADKGNPVYYASFLGLTGVVQMMLNDGGEVNTQGGYHGNALQAASWAGHEEVVQLLLAAGARVNVQGGEHTDALRAASISGNLTIVQLLLAAGAELNPSSGGRYGHALQAAATYGHRNVVDVLLAAGAKVNASGEPHGYALQAASAGGHKNIVKILLAAGAEVNACDEGSYTALWIASYCGHEIVVQTLLAAGADVHVRHFARPLTVASQMGHEKVVRMLLEAGAVDMEEIDAAERRTWTIDDWFRRSLCLVPRSTPPDEVSRALPL